MASECAQKRRGPSEFRILIMSATLDADKFVNYFSGAAAAWVRGRQFPVQVRHKKHALARCSCSV